ncbi:MAG: DUF3322 domain-containing protein, partial [Pseudomonadota bacterium]
LKFWQIGGFLRAMASGKDIFPLEVRFAKPSAATLIEQFGEIRDWISDLKAHSKETKSYGYRLEYRSVNHRQLSTQSLPARILFDDAHDFLRFIGKQKDFESFAQLRQITEARHPELVRYLSERPLRILEHADVWNGLLNVCGHYLQTRSMLMDRDTLEAFRHLCVEEEASKRETRNLVNLTESECRLYRDLVENRLGRHLRLEQERIGFTYLKRRLLSVTGE